MADHEIPVLGGSFAGADSRELSRGAEAGRRRGRRHGRSSKPTPTVTAPWKYRARSKPRAPTGWPYPTSRKASHLRRQAGIGAGSSSWPISFPRSAAAWKSSDLTPVIHSLEDLAVERTRRRAVPLYHLKIDSGMGRLGTRAEPGEIAQAVQAAPCAASKA